MTVHILLNDSIKLQANEFSHGAIAYIKRGLILRNPRFEQIERYSRFNYNSEPEFLTYYQEKEGCLILPRGYMVQLMKCLEYNSLDYQIQDETRKLPGMDISFNGNLQSFQDDAVNAALSRRYGFVGCNRMGFNRAGSNTSGNYNASYADSGTSNAAADTAAGGYNS